MIEIGKLQEGMVVLTADGARLGTIVTCRPEGFIIEKGLFFPKATQFHYEDVAELRRGEVYLAHGRAQLADESFWRKREEALRSKAHEIKATAKQTRPTPITAATVGAIPSVNGGKMAASHELEDFKQEEFRVPLAEEDVSAEKHLVESGEVRVHKRIVTTERQITVPVMHEELHVERVRLDPDSAPAVSEDAFVETTVTIPLHEEDVEIHKRAVLREEVRLTKQVLQETRTTSTQVRREEVDIEGPTAPGAHAQHH